MSIDTHATSWSPLPGLAQVVSGVGAVCERLAKTLEEQGVRRPMIVCGRNVGATPLVSTVIKASGLDCTRFDGSLEHTPVEAVDAGIAAARVARPDVLIALGGSSAIDCAKAIAVAMKLGIGSVRELPPISFTKLPTRETGEPVKRMPLICIPTTLSGAEFHALFGIRDARHKRPHAEQALVARTVFLDGEIAASTPAPLWLQTGAKTLDDCLMRFCVSQGGEPAWDAVLLIAIKGLLGGLGAGGKGDPQARQANFHHLWLPTCPVPRMTPFVYPGWLSIAVRHSLGGMIGLPHGIGSCVAMVEALRFHADETAARQAELAELLGGEGRPLTAIMSDWLDSLDLPANLNAAGVDKVIAGELAENVLSEAPGLGGETEVRAACKRLW